MKTQNSQGKSSLKPAIVSAPIIAEMSKAEKAHAAEALARKEAAIYAFGFAVLAGSEAAANEWEQYVVAVAYGAKPEEIVTGGARAIRQEYVTRTSASARKGKEEELRIYVARGDNPHIKGLDTDGAADAISLMVNRARQYKNRVTVLQEAGETLLSAVGTVRDGLQTKARKLQEARAKASRGTKARTDGKGQPGTQEAPTSEAPISSAVNPSNVAITDTLISRVLDAAMDAGEVGQRIRATHGEAFAKVAGMVALTKLSAQIARKVRGSKAATKPATPTAPTAPTAQEVAQATAAAADGLKAIMPVRERAPKGSKASAKRKQAERLAAAH